MQPDALQPATGQQRGDTVGAFVGDCDEHPGVGPDCAWQDERSGNEGCQRDDEWRRGRLDGKRPPHDLRDQLHHSSIADGAALRQAQGSQAAAP